ncbi:MAG: DUF1501 domain-containing protein [Planctomycetaceae bacterium]
MLYSHLCTPREHHLSRRQMLGAMGGMAAGLGLAGVQAPTFAEDLARNEKQVLLVWLDGGMSQLETWDPKPNTRYGGPYRSISTSVPGVQISELMPHTARQMHNLAVVRTMKTEDPNHSSGVPKILRGQPKDRGVVYPYLGSAVAKLLGPTSTGLPPYVWVKPGSGGFISKHAGFLGAKYGALAVGNGKPPENLVRPESISNADDEARNDLRKRLNERFAAGRRRDYGEANSFVFDLSEKLMQHADLFDASQLPANDVERYGKSEIGENMLLARGLLEAGVRMVHVQSYGWDTHGDNFNAHATRVPRFDRAFAAMMHDLDERGMLDNVLVICMAEFGRTPRINGSIGRDHWNIAWSLAMGGTGIRPGVVVGETNAEGTDVKSQPYDIGHMFHTWYSALGIDSQRTEYHNGNQPLPIAHDDYQPVRELLT